jgi:hypothetical protein
MSLSTLAPLSACFNLKKLAMRGCSGALSVSPLKACTQLEELEIQLGLGALKDALPQLRIS